MFDLSHAGSRPLCVLHVDDHSVNLRLVTDILTIYGHTSVAAKSGSEAIQHLGQRSFDVILTDINMPGMSGLELLRFVRNAPALLNATPVIALTAEVSRTRVEYLSLGFNELVTKPFGIAELLKAIDACAPRDLQPQPSLQSNARRRPVPAGKHFQPPRAAASRSPGLLANSGNT